jgi:hypothetical protein
MGLIIDFTTNSVAGFPSFSADRVKIIGVDKTTFGFSGTDGMGGAVFGTARSLARQTVLRATWKQRWSVGTMKRTNSSGQQAIC